ncbi:universal stress protein [Sphingomonas sp. MS122]|uniref:universal stress protein n=1 Tax=Sphingomonas sp. MS122 TaxID=3412683 RepID=UPI003C2DA7C3
MKNILAIVEAPDRAAPIIDAAAAMALAHEAHLEIAVLTPGPVASPALVPLGAMYVPDEVMVRDSKANVAAVEALAMGAHCPVAVFGLHDDVAWLAGDLRRSRQIADLIVIGTAVTWELHWLRRRVIETLILSSGTPLVILPPDRRVVRVRHAVLGWKPGPEANRALHDLVRLLEPEAQVDIVIVSDRPVQAADDQSGLEVRRHLGRHGFLAELHHLVDREHCEADALQQFAIEAHADLLAIGGFGHSRIREVMLGGVTRAIIEDARIPVLLSH